MYQVTVQERPARRWASLVGAGGAMALAVGLALYVTANKRHLPEFELGPPIPLDHWGATVRLPKGWLPVDRSHDGGDTRYLFLEQVSSGDPRQLELRRIMGHGYRPPSAYAVPQALLQLLELPVEVLQGPPVFAPATFGPYAAISVRAGLWAAIIGVAPGGDRYVAQIVDTTGVRRADLALLQACVDSLEFRDARSGRDAAALASLRSFSFELPAGARWLVETDGDPLLVHAVGAPTTDADWTMKVYRTFLAPGRRPRDLAADNVESRLIDAPVPAVQSDTISGRELAIAAVRPPGVETEVVSAVADLGGGEALLIAADVTPAARAALDPAIRRIVESVRLNEPTPLPADLAAASGEVARLAFEGLRQRARLGDRANWYLFERGGKVEGFYLIEDSAARREGRSGRVCDTRAYRDLGGPGYYVSRSRSFIGESEGVVEYRHAELYSSGRDETRRLVSETIAPGSDVIERLRQRDEETVRAQLPLPAGYVPPDLDHLVVLAQVAAGAGAAPAFFVSSGSASAQGVYWTRVDPAPDADGPAVWVRHDYSPAQQLWSFTSDGVPTEVRFESSITLRLCTQTDVSWKFREYRRLLRMTDALP